MEFNRLASDMNASHSHRAGWVSVWRRVGSSHSSAKEKLNTNPMNVNSGRLDQYGHFCDSLHKIMHHNRWRSRSPTASTQSRAVHRTMSVHRSFSLDCSMGVSYVVPYVMVLTILLMLWCLQMAVRLGYFGMAVQMRIHSCSHNQFQEGLYGIKP